MSCVEDSEQQNKSQDKFTKLIGCKIKKTIDRNDPAYFIRDMNIIVSRRGWDSRTLEQKIKHEELSIFYTIEFFAYGDTFPHREELSSLGFFFDGSTRQWVLSLNEEKNHDRIAGILDLYAEIIVDEREPREKIRARIEELNKMVNSYEWQ